MKNLIPSLSVLRASVWSVAVATAGSVLVSCAPIASVDDVTPPMPVAYVVNQSVDALVKAREEVKAGDLVATSDPTTAMSHSETAAMLSLLAMQGLSGKRADEAIGLYNYATARLVEEMTASGKKPWAKEIQLAGPNGPIWLSLKSDSEGAYVPGTDSLLATDRMDIGGTYLTNRVRIEGVGAPFVSFGTGRTEPWSPHHHYYSVTAMVTFVGAHGTLQIFDPLETTKVSLAGQERPLAADLTAPAALLITETQPQSFGLAALLDTDKFESSAKLVMVAPYRANRIPLIFIHGLGDSPVTWVPMINGLNASPEIRAKYQVWVFRYPSGLPYPLSAALFRDYLGAVYKKYPETPKAVLIGHSMGGLVADMMIRDSNGDQYTKDVLGMPLDQFKVDPSQVEVVRKALVFKPSPYVDKVVFIATPHRGADMASNPLGRLGASLINLPKNLVMMGPNLVTKMNASNEEEILDRFPNSIDTLRPEARIVVAMNKIPIDSSVTYYSIIGDRGENDSPNSSDGVVAYRSSHLDGAKSEKIVPAWHSYCQRCPEATAEVQRILLIP